MAPAAPSIRRPSDPEVGVAESDRAGSLAVGVLALTGLRRVMSAGLDHSFRTD
jgi:hypothetical protein